MSRMHRMSLSDSEKEKLLDEACAMIEDTGGFVALLEDLASRTKLSMRMTEMSAGLLAQYPNKWVALGDADILTVGDSMNDALCAMEKLGVERSKAVVRFMDTNPPVLIL